MLEILRKRARQRQTLESFDYQWSRVPEGDAMLSDPWFREHACEIAEEITGVSASWFPGKRVLDAGCGGGRWSYALRRLGAEVTAVDFSEAALERTRDACAALGPIETLRANLLDPPAALRDRRFDMVFSFGVLHHTGDTFAALANVASLVAETGLIFLYLYGSRSWTLRQRLEIEWTRLRLAGLSFDEKIEHLRRRYPDRDPHQAFDLLSPTINDRLTVAEVSAALEPLGLGRATPTIASGEVYLRAERARFPDRDALRPGGVPESESLLWSHVQGLDARRRDRRFERRLWEIGLCDGPPPAREPVVDLCARLGISVDALRGKRVLVVDPDSAQTARELRDAGADVSCLAPVAAWARRAGEGIRVVEGGVLDAPGGQPPYDAVFARGGAVAVARRPGAAVASLAARLATGGLLVVETLAPETTTAAHRRRRLVLKPWPFDEKIRRLLRANPGTGVAGALALLSAGLPPRMSEADMRSALAGAGCEEGVVRAHGNRVVAKGLATGARHE